MVPITYNLRNLVERKATTLMTALGIGMTVAVLVTALALTEGLGVLFAASGNPNQALVLRKGTDAELTSSVSSAAYDIIRNYDHIARGPDGKPLVSQECLVIANLPSSYSPDGMNLSVRGLRPIGLTMRSFKLTQGDMFHADHPKDPDHPREIIVGDGIASRYPDAALGKDIPFGKGQPWRVVGIFHSAQPAANSEIWCDLDQLTGAFERQGEASSLLVRLDSPADFNAFQERIQADQQTNMNALRETDYYAGMTRSGQPLEYLGFAVAIIMAIGSAFAATNTMYAAVARRSKEIGTLRALGFSRASVLLSFMLESICLALIGGIAGLLMALPINGLATGVGNFTTFTDVTFQFKVGPFSMAMGLAFAAIIGALGGFLPAYAASKKDIIQAMRDN